MLHSTFEINQYVIFKYQEEWHEGRIVDVVVDSRTYYKVISFSTLLEVPTLLYDHILQNNSDNIKKIKMAFDRIPVSREMRPLIDLDRVKASNNKIYKGPKTMGEIFGDFNDFLSSNKLYLSKEEISLCTEGLRHLFNSLVEKVLISPRELKYIDNLKRRMARKKETYFLYNHFGIVYGVRVVYYLLKTYLETISDLEVRFILFEYLIYFLDFCSLNLAKYYDKSHYE